MGPKLSCHRGPKFSPVTTLPPKKVSTPKLKYEALEISEVGAPLKKSEYTLPHFAEGLPEFLPKQTEIAWDEIRKHSSLRL